MAGCGLLPSQEWIGFIQTIPRLTRRYGETRYLAIGYIGDRLHAVVYTDRGDATRIISLRRANRQEEREYAGA